MITEVPQLAVGQLLNKQHGLAKGMKDFWVAGAGSRGNTWHDLTDSRNHGTLTGGPTWSSRSPPGGFGSLDFDGSGEWVNCGGMGQAGQTALTLTGWFRFSFNAFGTQRHFLQGIQDSGEGIRYTFAMAAYPADAQMRFFAYSAAGNPSETRIPESEFFENIWTHITMTWNGAGSKQIEVFINGRPAASPSYTFDDAAGAIRSGGTMSFGRDEGDTNRDYLGQCTSSSLHFGALPATKVRALYDESREGYPNLLNRGRRRIYPTAAAPAVGNPWYHYDQQEAAA